MYLYLSEAALLCEQMSYVLSSLDLHFIVLAVCKTFRYKNNSVLKKIIRHSYKEEGRASSRECDSLRLFIYIYI